MPMTTIADKEVTVDVLNFHPVRTWSEEGLEHE